jgi:hypothetical protein
MLQKRYKASIVIRIKALSIDIRPIHDAQDLYKASIMIRIKALSIDIRPIHDAPKTL